MAKKYSLRPNEERLTEIEGSIHDLEKVLTFQAKLNEGMSEIGICYPYNVDADYPYRVILNIKTPIVSLMRGDVEKIGDAVRVADTLEIGMTRDEERLNITIGYNGGYYVLEEDVDDEQ